MQLRAILICSSILCCPSALMAQNSIHDVQHIDEVVTTATRTPKLLKEVPVQTRVISRSDIAAADATNLQDLLQHEMPGVEFSYAMNQTVNMNLSGFAGQGVLILVDGERLAGETMDNVDFTRLSMANIERIEIVRGSASALYGSSAAGGVVNIITHKEEEPWTLHVDGRWGQHNSQRYNLVQGLHQNHIDNTLTFSRTSADNYNVQNRGNEPKANTFVQVFGDKTLDIKDQLKVKVSNKLDVSGRLGYFYRTLSRVADTPERYRDYTAGLKANWQMDKNDQLEFSYSYDQYDKSDFQKLKNLDIRRYSNVQNASRLLYNHTFGKGSILTIGTDYLYDYLLNTNLDGDHRQQSYDLFAQYDWRITDRLEVVGALRYDYFSDGNLQRVTPRLSARWYPCTHVTMWASYGMGFRAPTLKEKYYDFDMVGIWIIEGNQQLKPEESHNTSFSMEYTNGGYSATLTTNYNRVDNRITSGLPYHHADDGLQWYLPYINLGGMNVYGMELTLQGRWKNGWNAKASYAFNHEDLAGSTANQYMPARKHSLTVRGGWQHDFSKQFTTCAVISGRAMSGVSNEEYYSLSDPERGTHTVEYPGYSLWKLMLTGTWKKGIGVSFTVDNLFNYRPEYYYYNAPLTQGTNIAVGINIDIDKFWKK